MTLPLNQEHRELFIIVSFEKYKLTFSLLVFVTEIMFFQRILLLLALVSALIAPSSLSVSII